MLSKKKLAISVGLMGAFLLGITSYAVADSNNSLKSASLNLDVREVIKDYSSPSWGNNTAFYAECPEGYSVIGGGGWHQGGGAWSDIKASYPEQGSRRWWVVMDAIEGVPARVFATCLDT